jgi:Ataxin-3
MLSSVINYLDTGFFSIQVLQKALEVYSIELIPYASQDLLAQHARDNPQSVEAYICNLREHWLAIRRFGQQYFDLNSISSVPKFISNTYLSLYLAQLQQSGYSIFIVQGQLPECRASVQLSINPIDPTYYRALSERIDVDHSTRKQSSKTTTRFNDQDLERALKASVDLENSEDQALQHVLEQSLRDAPSIDDNELYEQRLLDQAIAASLDQSNVQTNETRTEPTIEGMFIGCT